ncbi:HTH-type transcriptional regulator RutR [Dermatophilus congolensis]|uniref:HTH-type transcriptional regulator RutR n=2 Tax=Dermatophilus congolensis TaxID=1863 RepID=A0AA46BLW7_9MICO|nr:HTH-type transcriptional regulator RutR [Dermatophilus congolensis]
MTHTYSICARLQNFTNATYTTNMDATTNPTHHLTPSHRSITPETEGLRERKKRETRARIHRSAIELAHQHGLESLTIEAIAAQADVSPRTLFNYYRSKEAAILGISSDITERIITALQQQPVTYPPLTALRNALRPLIDIPHLDDEFHTKRRRILTQYPELATTSMNLVVETEKALTQALIPRLAHSEKDSSEVEIHMRAALLAITAVGVTRATWVTRAHHDLSLQSAIDTFERGFDSLRSGLDTTTKNTEATTEPEPPHPHTQATPPSQ